jgi:hypothetical protein
MAPDRETFEQGVAAARADMFDVHHGRLLVRPPGVSERWWDGYQWARAHR